jgi:hypothetical protein
VLTAIAGALWSNFDAGRMVYSPAQAKEWAEASSAFHLATSGHAPDGSEMPESEEERDAIVAAARQRYEKAQAVLDSARFTQYQLGSWLIRGGLAAVAIFGVGYGATRQAE